MPARVTSRTAATPSAKRAEQHAAIVRARGARVHAHGRLDDHAERAFGAEQQLIQFGTARGTRHFERPDHTGRRHHARADQQIVDAAVAVRLLAGGARRDPAAQRRVLEGLREVAERVAARGERGLERRAVDARPGTSPCGSRDRAAPGDRGASCRARARRPARARCAARRRPPRSIRRRRERPRGSRRRRCAARRRRRLLRRDTPRLRAPARSRRAAAAAGPEGCGRRAWVTRSKALVPTPSSPHAARSCASTSGDSFDGGSRIESSSTGLGGARERAAEAPAQLGEHGGLARARHVHRLAEATPAVPAQRFARDHERLPRTDQTGAPRGAALRRGCAPRCSAASRRRGARRRPGRALRSPRASRGGWPSSARWSRSSL